MSGVVLPHGIYLDIYKLLDDPYKPETVKDQEAIQGFIMFSNKIMNTCNLGYIFEHMSDLTNSLKS